MHWHRVHWKRGCQPQAWGPASWQARSRRGDMHFAASLEHTSKALEPGTGAWQVQAEVRWGCSSMVGGLGCHRWNKAPLSLSSTTGLDLQFQQHPRKWETGFLLSFIAAATHTSFPHLRCTACHSRMGDAGDHHPTDWLWPAEQLSCSWN